MKKTLALLATTLLLTSPFSAITASDKPEKKLETTEKKPPQKRGVTCSRDPDTGMKFCIGSFTEYSSSGGLCCHHDMKTGEKYCH
ncbi:hypothetical protein NB640_00715 [Oxalobacter vibrioformis]|uniref:Uncharacterized protein n=1 Tax=Oxalobacter vibrioformis TaxID=933080 RepID=A0A9E9LZ70_9BURK|nr:hypothetical protein [Oxalobacter vibrioformis]WAW10224.1 hypothetical protein NB640_00715 [Oxalobacter vibrioformis]